MGNAEVMKSYSAFDVYILRRNWSIQSNLFATPYLYSTVVLSCYCTHMEQAPLLRVPIISHAVSGARQKYNTR